MIRFPGQGALMGAVLGLMLVLPVPGQATDLSNREAWECANGTCVQREESHLGQLHGSFDYGANVSSFSNSKRIKALEAQQYAKYQFWVPNRMKVYARSQKDENWVPADWPKDIGIQSGGPGIDLYMTVDGTKWNRVDQGSIMPGGATVEVLVIQSTGGTSAYRTFYPARWTADVTFKRVKFDEGWGDDFASTPGPKPIGDAAAHFTGASADDAGQGNCRDGNCYEPDPVPVLQDPQVGECGDGDVECKPEPEPQPIDNAAAAIPDPQPECGTDQMECLPDDGQIPEPVSDTEPSAAAAATAADKPEPMKSTAIARMVQRELHRLGCYEMEVDGLWGPGSTRALRNYNHWHGSLWTTDTPTPEALEEMLGVRGPVCGVD